MKTIEQDAATTVTCATFPKVENGAYYSDCEVAQEHPNANIEEDKTALFEYCDEVTKKFQWGNRYKCDAENKMISITRLHAKQSQLHYAAV